METTIMGYYIGVVYWGLPVSELGGPWLRGLIEEDLVHGLFR